MDWIRVEESLPETGKKSVLGSDYVLAVAVDDYENQYRTGARYVATPIRPKWIDDNDKEIHVTHWMHWPDLPMYDSEENVINT